MFSSKHQASKNFDTCLGGNFDNILTGNEGKNAPNFLPPAAPPAGPPRQPGGGDFARTASFERLRAEARCAHGLAALAGLATLLADIFSIYRLKYRDIGCADLDIYNIDQLRRYTALVLSPVWVCVIFQC